MPEPSRPPPTAARDVSPREMVDAVSAVLKDQAQKAEVRRTVQAPRERSTSPVAKVALVVLTALSLYLWLGRPAWLQPAPPEPLPPALSTAGLKMEVYLQALRVNAFLEERGRLPTSLEEAGDPFTEVRYQQVGPRVYRVWWEGSPVTVQYRSDQDLQDFLGDAALVIREGGREGGG